jgi:hypothetical protein
MAGEDNEMRGRLTEKTTERAPKSTLRPPPKNHLRMDEEEKEVVMFPHHQGQNSH